MTATATAIPEDDDDGLVLPVMPPINAKFRQRLPDIINDISNELLVIEPAVSRVALNVREVFDYLDYEIKKADLEVKMMKWESMADPQKLAAAEAWLKQLQALRTDFNEHTLKSPAILIRTMLRRYREMFVIP